MFGDGVAIWWAGMMRGAVSVAMVYYSFDPNNTKKDSHSATIVVTTVQVVLFSTVILGGITGPLLKLVLTQSVRRPRAPPPPSKRVHQCLDVFSPASSHGTKSRTRAISVAGLPLLRAPARVMLQDDAAVQQAHVYAAAQRAQADSPAAATPHACAARAATHG